MISQEDIDRGEVVKEGGRTFLQVFQDKNVREITCKRWFLRKSTAAIVLYPWIFYRGDLTKEQRHIIRKHEWVHVEQIHRLGWVRFYVTYLWYSMRYVPE